MNLIDTPGHPDFIAEVERVLRVLDGAVLVVSAVEGVQAQTRVLMRTLKRLRIPTLIFINKTDRRGADPERVAREVAGKLRIAAAPVGSTELAELLADHDDAFLAAYLDGGAHVGDELAAQTRRALVHPVFRGSAITGAGVDELTRGIRDLLPAADGRRRSAAGTVFKVERGGRQTCACMRAGTLHVRERVGDDEGHRDQRVRARRRRRARRAATRARSARSAGLTTCGSATRSARRGGRGPPVRAPDARDGRRARTIACALHRALTELAEQDPLINLRLDGDELAVSLYGEVQKEVIEATLADRVRARGRASARRRRSASPSPPGRARRSSSSARTSTWRRSGCGSSPARA